MALGLSLSLGSLPGVSSLLAKVDSYKAAFLAVPERVNKALDKLAFVRQAMAQNNAPPSAQSDALNVKQHLDQVKSEWTVASSAFAKLQGAGANLSLDTVVTAGHLLTSISYVLGNTSSLEDSVNNLAAKYLTPTQQQQLTRGGGLGGASLGTLALLGVGLFVLTRNRG